MKRISVAIILILALSTNSISPAKANLGPEGINCPELSGAVYPNVAGSLDVRALNFNGQYLQRVDIKTGKLVEKPQGILGCYKYFSANTGYDARWDVGVIDYINLQEFDADTKTAFWSRLDSKERSAIKKFSIGK